MLSDDEFNAWCNDLRLSAETRRTIAEIRRSPPSRAVSGRRSNVIGRFPSRKMGVTIQFESHEVELPAIYEFEHDASVLEYYDQPLKIPLSYNSIRGRRVTAAHTPDFFVLRADGAGWEECKPASDLVRLAEKSPGRYLRDGEKWRCPPGESIAESLGLYYRLRSSDGINWVYQRNLRFLADYLENEHLAVEARSIDEIFSLLPERGYTTLASLLSAVQAATADDVYVLVAQQRIYVNLSGVPLAEPRRVRVFRDEAASQASAGGQSQDVLEEGVAFVVGKQLEWDGRVWSVANVGTQSVALVGADRQVVEIMRHSFEALVLARAIVAVPSHDALSDPAQELLDEASPGDLDEALGKLRLIQQYREGKIAKSASVRSLQSWTTRFKRAEEVYGCGLVGLLPRRHKSGNRTPRLPAETRDLTIEFIRVRYENTRHVVACRAYEALVLECDRRNITPPSYKTFCEYVLNRSGYKQDRDRCGERAAYGRSPFVLKLELTTPRHGDRPFEIVHIDHTELDIELVDSDTGKELGRPWATFVTDAYTRRLLAVVCLYDPPSYRSCLVALRWVVRRFNRFPGTIVVDNGREFNSRYFETLLGKLGAIKKSRPPGEPRFGAVVERLFGTANTELVHTLRGNTQLARIPRSVTGSLVPKRQALWTLPELDRVLREWAYDVYDTREHPALAVSPRHAFEAGLARTGLRKTRIVPYDEAFRFLTLPSTDKGTARVISNRGVQIRKVYYWTINDAFRSPRIEGTDVHVRYDPFNVGIAYAYVGSTWVRCISEYYAELRDRSERELQIASLELRKSRQIPVHQRMESIRQLARFISSTEASEALLLQRMRDRETRLVLEGSVSTQESAPAAEANELSADKPPKTRSKRKPRTTKGAIGPLAEFERY